MADKENTNVGNIEGSAIGYVRLVKGHATATSTDGTVRVLSVGDMVFPDEIIQTGPDGGVVIEFRDGAALALGGDSEALIDREVYDIDTAKEIQDQTAIIDDIQQALLAGADPTEILEAPAAGGEGGGDATSDSAGDPVAIERTGERVTPESGFETRGLQFADERTEEEEGLPAVEPDAEPLPAPNAPTFTLSGDATVAEGASATYNIVLSGGDVASGETVVLSLDTANGTAINPADFGDLQNASYNAATNELTLTGPFTNGATVASLTVDAVDDTVFEGNEGYSVSLTSATVDGTTVSATGTQNTTITDNDAPTFTLSGDATVAEGASATYNIVLSGGDVASGETVVLSLDTANGTAINPADFGDLQNASYNAATNELTLTGPFTNGATVASLTVDAVDDTVFEGNEGYSVSLTSATVDGTTVSATGTQNTTITDNDAPTFTLSGDATVAEGASATYNIVLSGGDVASGETVVLSLDTANGTAINPADFGDLQNASYNAATNELTLTGPFTNGATVASLTVDAVDDTVFEGNEGYSVSLTSATVDGTTVSATGTQNTTITDNDAPTFTLSGDATVAEGASATYNIVLSGGDVASGETVVLSLDTANGTAINPADFGDLQNASYNAATNELTLTGPFTNGATVASLTVDAVDDTVFEGNEGYSVSLTSATVDGTTVSATGTQNTTITDNDAPTFTLSGDATVAEGASATYNIVLSGGDVASGETVVLSLDTANGTAINPADFGDLQNASYNAATNELTLTGPFTNGATVASLTVDAVDDTVFEGNEGYSVSLTSATVDGTTVSATGTQNTTITDNDAPTFTLSGDATVAEGASATYNIVLSGGDVASGETVVLSLDTANGTAINPADFGDLQNASYNAATNELTLTGPFTNGATVASLTVDAVDDTVFEGNEGYSVSLTSATVDGTTVSATGTQNTTITDNDAPTFTLSGDATVAEGASATYNIVLSGGDVASGETVVLSLDTANGTAINPADFGDLQNASYNAATNELTLTGPFTNGATVASLTVDAVDDTVFEGNEGYSVSLTSATVDGTTVSATGTQNTTITDNDAPTFTLSGDATVAEGASATYNIVLSGGDVASGETVVLSLDTANGTAINPADFGDLQNASYNAATNELTLTGPFTNGATVASLTVDAVDDTVFEGNEGYSVSLTSATVDGTTVSATGTQNTTITDNDAPTFTLSGDATVAEGASATYNIVLSGGDVASGETVVLSLDTANGTAINPADFGDLQNASYNAATNELTLTGPFTNGATVASLTVDAVDDTVFEGNEGYSVSLTSATVDGTTVSATGTQNTTITDNDAPTFTLSGDATVAEGASATYNIVLSGGDVASGETVVLSLDTANGTAINPADFGDLQNASYNAATNELTLTGPFTNGATVASLTVDAVDDTVFEGNEGYSVSLTSATVDGTTVSATGTQNTTITDNDAPTFTLSGDATVAEGASATYNIVLSGGDVASGETVVLSLDTANGTAINPADFGDLQNASYNAATNELTLTGPFTNGATVASLTVDAVDDTVFEGNEGYSVSLTSATVDGTTVSATGTQNTTITDNDAPTFTLSGDATVAEGASATYNIVLSGGDVASGETVVLSLDAANGTAINPADFGDLQNASYNAATNELTLTGPFTNGATVASLTVDAVDDTVFEGNEGYSVSLTSATVDGTTVSATGTQNTTITDNDAPTFTLSGDATVAEGASATYNIVLSGGDVASGETVVLSLDTANGTAINPADFGDLQNASYNAATNELTLTGPFTNGATVASLTVDAVDDTVFEGNEGYSVSLTSATVDGTTVSATGTQNTTITDNDAPTFTLSGDATVAEGASATYNIVLSGGDVASGETVVLSLDTANGTAINPADFGDLQNASYNAATNELTLTGPFTNGATVASLTVDAVDDTVFEGNEGYSVSLTSATVDGTTVSATGTQNTTITDNDAPTFTLSGDATVAEGASATYNIVLSGGDVASGETVVLSLDAANGTAINPADFGDLQNASYNAATNELTLTGPFTNGATVASLTVDAVDDTVFEGNEGYSVSLTSATVDGTTVSATGTQNTTITDNDAPTFTLSGDATVAEGASATYNIVLSGGDVASGETVVLSLDTANGTAINPADFGDLQNASYNAATNELTLTGPFTNGATVASLTVDAVDDTVFEGNEGYSVSLTSATVDGTTVSATGTQNTTITDNDAPTFTLSGDATVAEGASATYNIVLSGGDVASGETVVLSLDTANGTAINPADFGDLQNASYNAATNELTLTGPFTNGATVASLTVDAVDDTVFEGNEGYSVSLTSATVDGTTVSATGTQNTTITDNDAPTFTLSGDATVAEGASATYNIVLSGGDVASGETVVLSLDTANGTAINPADFGDLQNASYNAATNELTLTGPFTNGATVASLTVDAVDDTVFEGNEGYSVSLTSATVDGTTVSATGTQNTTITDNDAPTFTLSGDATVAEGASATYNIVLSGGDVASGETVVLSLDTANGTAINPADFGDLQNASYNAATNELTLTGPFTNGATVASLTVDAVDDTVFEGNEGYSVSLTSATVDGTTVSATGTQNTTITDNDAPTFTLSGDATVAEGASATYNIVLSGGDVASGETVVLSLDTANGTAINPADFGDLQNASYNAATNELTLTGPFTNGATVASLTVDAVDDTVFEGNEGYSVSLTSATVDGTTVSATGTQNTTITDNDAPTFTLSGDATVAEGASATYNIVLSGGDVASGETVVLSLDAANGTAINPADFGDLQNASYNAATNELTLTGPFTNGATVASLTVDAVDDTVFEGNEGYSVSLTSATVDGTTVSATGTQNTTITDNDAPTFTLSGDATVAEGASATYNIVLSGGDVASGETVVLSLDTANGTAINPADFGDLQNASYNAATNELTLTGPFTNGATVASLTVDAVDDTVFEGNEGYSVSLTSATVDGTTVSATGTQNTTITDNDAPTFTLSGDATVAEGASATYNIVLSGGDVASGETVVLSLDTANGTAINPADFGDLQNASYNAATNELTLTGPFTNGATVASLTVDAVDDTVFEGNEGYSVSLTSATVDGTTVSATGTQNTTITDNDAPTFTLSGDATVAEGASATYNIVLSGGDVASGETVVLSLDTANGTAINPADFGDLQNASYNAATNELTLTGPFTNGATVASLTVDAVDDTVFEGNEGYSVSLTSATVDGTTVSATGTQNTTITDNDAPTFTLSGDATVAEGASATYNIVLSGGDVASGETVVLSLDTANGTAINPADFGDLQNASYNAATNELTLTGPFTNGATVASLTVDAVDDTVFEGNEGYSVSLTSATVDGTTVSATGTQNTTITDNDAPTFTLSGDATVAEGASATYNIVLSGGDVASGETVVLSLDTANGTAINPADFGDLQNASYNAATNELTLTGPFTNGATVASLTVDAVDDTVFEGNEGYSVSLTSATVDGTTVSATGTQNTTITDNDAPTFTLSGDATVAEGASATYNIVLSGGDVASGETVVLSLDTANGTAINPADFGDLQNASYNAATNELTLTGPFTNGATVASLTVDAVDDTVFEGNEGYSVSLTSATVDGTTVSATGTQNTTITDNDAPTFTLSGDATVAEGASATYNIVLSGGDVASGETVVLSLDAANGTAINPADFGDLQNASYNAATNELTLTGPFTNGATVASLTVDAVDDTVFEGNEGYSVSLTSATVDGTTVSATGTQNTTITDNDAPTFTLSGDATVAEGASATYNIVLSGGDVASGETVVLSLDTANGTAINPADFGDLQNASYNAATNELTLTGPFTNGATVASLTVDAVDDTVFEGNEGYSVSLTSATVDGTTVSATGTQNTTITDNDAPTFTLSGDATVAEGASATYNIVLSGGDVASGETVVLSLDTANGTAINPADFGDLQNASYNAATNELTLTGPFTNGATVASLTVDAVDDTVFEGNEGYSVSLTSATVDGTTVSATGTQNTTITDNDAPTFTLSGDATVAEGASATYNIVLSGGDVASGETVVLSLDTANGTAINPADFGDLQNASYNAATNELTLTGPFTNGATVASLTVDAVDDTVFEGNEGYSVSLTSATVDGTTVSATGTQNTTITDNDAPTFTLSGDATVAEGASATYNIVLSGGDVASGETVVLSLDTANGTAINPADFGDLQNASYNAATNELTLTGPFTNGATVASLTVDAVDDTVFEGNEGYSVSLTSATVDGTTVSATGTQNTTITDNDAPTFTLSGDATVAEGASATYNIVLSGGDVASGETVVLSLDTANGTAINPADFGDLQNASYNAATNELTLTGPFTNGATVASLTVDAVDDTVFEGNEGYSVSLTSATVDGTTVSATGTQNTTITDNDAPTFTLSGDATVAEGASATYNIVLSGGDVASGETVVLSLDTANGTAINPADFGDLQNASYNAATNELTLTGPFTNGATVASLTVDAVDDTVFEGNEGYSVSLTSATVDGTTVSATGTQNTTITDNDAPTFTLSGDATVAEGASATYNIVLSGGDVASGETVVLSLDTANGTAINPADFGDLQNASYNAATNELTLTGPFTNGATVASLTVDAVDDTVFEGNEGYSVSLTSATVDGTTVSATGTQNTTITDNDAPTFTLSGDATVAEGASATYNIVLSGGDVASGETVVLSLDTANGTAINPADFGDLQNASYNAATNELTLTGPFTNGATVASLTVDAVDDTVFEGNEGYSVSLTSATVDGTTVSATGTQNTTITDNDAPTFTLSGDATVAEGASATYNIVLSGGDVASGETVVLSLDTANGTAINPADFGDLQNASYNAATNELTLTGPFTNGATVASLTVDAVDDTVFEGNEGYSVSLTSATVDGTTVSATGTQNTTITDNDTVPFVIDSAVSGTEDTPYIFDWTDFNYTDTDGGPAQQIVITSQTVEGRLEYNGVSGWAAVTPNQTITKAEIDSGSLRFMPHVASDGSADPHESGANAFNDGTPGVGDQQEDFATFTYQASDGVNAGNSATMTIDIEPVADAPTLTVDGTVDAGGTSLLDQVTIPTTVGLIQTVYSNTGQSPNRLDSVDLEGITDSLAGGVSNIVAQPYRDGGNGPNNIDEDSIQVTTGIIYLTAGDQLSFDGYNDDALLIDVGGNVLIHTTGDAWGDYDTSQVGTRNATGGGAGMSVTEAGVFSAPVTGYYTFEMYIYNHSGPGDLSVNATLNGAPTPFNTANFTMYPDIASVDAADGQHSDFNLIAGDGGYYPIALNEGVEGAPIKLTAIDAALVDVDGSETLASIVISDIPEGAVLSDGGGNTFTATLGNTSVDVTAWNLDNLTFVGDADSGAVSDSYTLTVTATSEETANGDTAQTTLPLVITVSDTAPVAVDDNDSVGVEGVITGNVVTGAGGDGTGQDQVNAVDTPTGDAWLSGVDGQLFSGGSLVLDGTYGTLTIDADGAYTYQSKIVAGSITGSGNNESLWADVGYYAFDNNELPFIGATAGTGLDAALLTQGRSDDVVFNGGDLGVDADNNSDVDIDADEYIVFDLEGLASTVSVGLTDFGNNDWADWYAFAEDGSLVGSGSKRGDGNDVLDVSANIDSSKLIQYIAIQPRAGDDIEVRSLNYGVPTTQVFEDQFTYTLTDEDGDSSTAVLTIETKDHTPVAVTDTATVSESALPTGSDAAASETISGNLFANDTGLEDGATITTFGGSSTIVGDEITITTALGSAVVNVQTGDYTYTLENPADHSAGAVTDVISYTVEDVDGQSSSSALQVAIVDDAPVSGDLEPAVIRPVPINTELSIVFDKSGSMGSTVLDADGNPISRYELAKRAVGELVETYDAMGQVRVNIVMFDSSTEIDGNTNANGVSAWFDNAADAMAHIDLYSAGGGTDYDDPLISLEAGYSAPAAFVADQTFAYFMSDGNPNTSSDRAEIIAYENAWRNWSDTTYDKVFSIGIGSGASNTYLDLVASENPDGSENTIIIPDESQLVEMLLDTVPQVAGGQINVGGFGLNSFTPGADLPGQVLEITIEHRDYDTDALLDTVTYDTNSPEVSNDLLTVTTGRGAIVQVNMQTGEYSYLASADNNSGNDFKEVVKALYQDADGDTAVASVAFFVNQTDGLHDGVTLNYDAHAPVDGTTGVDTLIVPSNDALDFSGIDNISNVERLDLSVGDHAVTNLSVDDVINMTDSNQLLEILGDATDTVGLIAGDWTATGNTVVSDDGHSFAEYQDAAGSVTLLIEDTITVS